MEKEIKIKKGSIFYWKCPRCNKEIAALSRKQLLYLVSSHELKHRLGH